MTTKQTRTHSSLTAAKTQARKIAGNVLTQRPDGWIVGKPLAQGPAARSQGSLTISSFLLCGAGDTEHLDTDVLVDHRIAQQTEVDFLFVTDRMVRCVATPAGDPLFALRTETEAKQAGLWLSGEKKEERISGRVSPSLLEAVRKKTGLTSDTDIITAALTRLALDDDFGTSLLAKSGTLPEDLELAIES